MARKPVLDQRCLKESVREANAGPYNLREGTSKPYSLHFSGKTAEVVIGSNSFTCDAQGYGTAMVPTSVEGLSRYLGDRTAALQFERDCRAGEKGD